MAGQAPDPRAGEVYWVETAGRGHEQRGRRPMVVIQDDDAAVLSTRLCVPTSKSPVPAAWRVEVEVGSEQTYALTEQLRVVSNERLTDLAGSIRYDELAEIRTAAARLIGIGSS